MANNSQAEMSDAACAMLFLYIFLLVSGVFLVRHSAYPEAWTSDFSESTAWEEESREKERYEYELEYGFSQFRPSVLDDYSPYIYKPVAIVAAAPVSIFRATLLPKWQDKEDFELTGYRNIDRMLTLAILCVGAVSVVATYLGLLYAYYVAVLTYRLRWRRHILYLFLGLYLPALFHMVLKAGWPYLSGLNEWLFAT